MRAKHKERFSAVCQQKTGLSTGFQPQDAVARKRLQNSTETNMASKKQRTDNGPSGVTHSSNHASVTSVTKPTYVTVNEAGPSICDKGGSSSQASNSAMSSSVQSSPCSLSDKENVISDSSSSSLCVSNQSVITPADAGPMATQSSTAGPSPSAGSTNTGTIVV